MGKRKSVRLIERCKTCNKFYMNSANFLITITDPCRCKEFEALERLASMFDICSCGSPKFKDSKTCLRLECEIGTIHENESWE